MWCFSSPKNNDIASMQNFITWPEFILRYPFQLSLLQLTVMMWMLLAAALVIGASAFSPSNHQYITINTHSTLYANNGHILDSDIQANTRRKLISSTIGFITSSSILSPWQAAIADDNSAILGDIIVSATGDTKKLFNEGRALEAQGNILAAQRLYSKVTKIAPNFIYGWSNLGNTLVAQGQLPQAEESYSKAISLCEENIKQVGEGEDSFGKPKCKDLYLILLNRGSVRLNNDMPKEALVDLRKSNAIRGRPDATILQNLARAEEVNALYSQSDRSYTTAISMTANEVNPIWLRSSMVKYQIGDMTSAMDLMKRVDNRFPEAPEVRAAYAVLLHAKGDEDSARKKFLEIPDRQREKYSDATYVDKVVAWPPKMKEGLEYLTKAVGDSDATSASSP